MASLFVLLRRRQWFVLLLGLASLTAVPLLVILAWEDSITEANCAKIEVGMTEEQVNAILGRVADEIPRYEPTKRIWLGRRGRIYLVLHPYNHCVYYKDYREYGPPPNITAPH